MDWSYAYSKTYLGDKDFKFGLDWSFAYSTTCFGDKDLVD